MQPPTKLLIAALRHFDQGRIREAAVAARNALQLSPELGTNPATSAIFKRFSGKTERTLAFCSEDVEFWLEDERLTDDWRRRAEELLARTDRTADLANSLSIIADAKDLLREIAAENARYHEVASFAWGQKRPPHYHEAAVKALAFGPENLLAAYIDDSEYGNIRVWDMSRNHTAWTEEHRFSLGEYCSNCLSFSSDGTLLAFTDPFVRLRQASTGKAVKWPDDSCFYKVVAFGQDNLLLTVADTKSGSTKNPPLCLWDMQTRRPVFQIQETSPIRSAAFGPEGVLSQDLALGTYDGRIHIWELSWTWTEEIPDLDLRFTEAHHVRTLHADRREIMSAAFSPDDGLLAAADGTDQVRVWNIATGDLLKSLTVSADRFSQPFTAPPGCGWCNSAAFSPTDPQHLAIGCSDGTVRVWDVPSGEQVALLNQGMGQAVRVVAFHADGTLATGSQNGRVHLWRRGLPDREQRR